MRKKRKDPYALSDWDIKQGYVQMSIFDVLAESSGGVNGERPTNTEYNNNVEIKINDKRNVD